MLTLTVNNLIMSSDQLLLQFCDESFQTSPVMSCKLPLLRLDSKERLGSQVLSAFTIVFLWIGSALRVQIIYYNIITMKI